MLSSISRLWTIVHVRKKRQLFSNWPCGSINYLNLIPLRALNKKRIDLGYFYTHVPTLCWNKIVKTVWKKSIRANTSVAWACVKATERNTVEHWRLLLIDNKYDVSSTSQLAKSFTLFLSFYLIGLPRA